MTETGKDQCPLCFGGSVRSGGEVKHFLPEEVGGINVNPSGVRFELRVCTTCGFIWKWPPLDEALLLKGYEQLPANHWAALEDGHVRQFDYMADLVRARAPGNSILDVGCFNGELLRHFGDSWRRFGVEPSIPAAEVARSKGVDILGPTLESLDPAKHSFDCIVSVDVVEHLPSPRGFFEKASQLLKPDGVLLIVTGDTDARTWRWYGSHYWYCSYLGHISFFNRRSIGWMGKACGLDVVHYERGSHLRSGPARHVKDWIKNARFAAASHLPGLPKAWSKEVPHWISAHDHMFAMLMKQPV